MGQHGGQLFSIENQMIERDQMTPGFKGFPLKTSALQFQRCRSAQTSRRVLVKNPKLRA